MFKLSLKLIIFMSCIFFVFSTTSVLAEVYQFKGTLTCSKIGPKHPEQTNASGEVFFQLDEAKQELSYKLQVKNIEDVYMAHLHVGPCKEEIPAEKVSDKQQPIAAWLYPCGDHNTADRCIEGEFSGTLAEGVIKPEDLLRNVTFSHLIKALRNSNAYVNVHTRKYPTCEICGRITPAE